MQVNTNVFIYLIMNYFLCTWCDILSFLANTVVAKNDVLTTKKIKNKNIIDVFTFFVVVMLYSD